MPTLSVAKDCLVAQGQIKQSKRGLVPTPSYWLIMIDWLIIVITNFGLRNSVTIDWLTTVITNFWLRNSVTKGFSFHFWKMPKDTAVCLACGKKFTKTEASVQCTVCGLWAHKNCIGMSDEIFNFINAQFKQTGTAYWACRPCTAYAQGMNHRVKQLEEEMQWGLQAKTAC